MKNTARFAIVFSIVFAGAGLSASAGPMGDEREARCSLKTLQGTYAYSNQGFKGGEPYASAGLMSFNGAGQVALIYTSSVERTQLSTKGTYAVDSNCSGTMALETKTIHNLYLSPSGDSFNYVRTSGDGVIGSQARRVSRGLIVKQP